MLAYKFVEWDIEPLEKNEGTPEHTLARKLYNGEKFTREEKNRITKLVHYNGCIKLHGWKYPCEGLKWFYVEQYGHVSKQRGYDKTAVRALYTGRIHKITERL